jgi:hypothetical protein
MYVHMYIPQLTQFRFLRPAVQHSQTREVRYYVCKGPKQKEISDIFKESKSHVAPLTRPCRATTIQGFDILCITTYVCVCMYIQHVHTYVRPYMYMRLLFPARHLFGIRGDALTKRLRYSRYRSFSDHMPIWLLFISCTCALCSS